MGDGVYVSGGGGVSTGALNTFTAQQDISSYDQAVLGDKPLVYYRLNETSGTTATDSGQNPQNLTYATMTLNQGGLVSGDTDGSVLCNPSGTNGNNGNPTAQITGGTGTYQLPFGNSPRTLEVWFAFTAVPGNGQTVVLCAWGSNFFGFGFSGVAGGANPVGFANGSQNVTWSSVTINDANAHHAVLTYDGNGQMNLVLDGVDRGWLTVPNSQNALATNGANRFVLGCHTDGVSFCFAGRAQKLAIYSYALPQKRAIDHYQKALSGANASLLAAGPVATPRVIAPYGGRADLYATRLELDEAYGGLRRFARALQRADDIHILCFGDSITTGVGASSYSNLWPAKLRSYLQPVYGNAGPGFMSVYDTNGVPGNLGSTAPWTFPAGWTVPTNGPTGGTAVDQGTNLATARANNTASGGAICQVPLKPGANAGDVVTIKVVYTQTGAGSAYTGTTTGTVKVGSASTQLTATLNCTGASGAYAYHNVASFTYTLLAGDITNGYIQIVFTSGDVNYIAIEGVSVLWGATPAGVVVHKVGHAGAGASNYAGDAASTTASLGLSTASALRNANQAAPDLVICELGVNDIANAASGSTRQTVETMLSNLFTILGQVGLAETDVMLIGVEDFQASQYANTHMWEEAIRGMRKLCRANDWRFLSIYDLWQGSYAWASNRGYYYDGIHPSDAGHLSYARAVLESLPYKATGRLSAPKKLTATVGAAQVSVAHGLNYVPDQVSITMTSAGSIQKSAASDATNVYLTADAASRTCEVLVR